MWWRSDSSNENSNFQVLKYMKNLESLQFFIITIKVYKIRNITKQLAVVLSSEASNIDYIDYIPNIV